MPEKLYALEDVLKWPDLSFKTDVQLEMPTKSHASKCNVIIFQLQQKSRLTSLVSFLHASTSKIVYIYIRIQTRKQKQNEDDNKMTKEKYLVFCVADSYH